MLVYHYSSTFTSPDKDLDWDLNYLNALQCVKFR
jgi:hypothetical protein